MSKSKKSKTKVTKEDIYKMYRKVNRQETIDAGLYSANPPKVESSEKHYKRKEKHKKG